MSRWTLKMATIKNAAIRYYHLWRALPEVGRTLISTIGEFRTEKFAGVGGGYTRDANTDTVKVIFRF